MVRRCRIVEPLDQVSQTYECRRGQGGRRRQLVTAVDADLFASRVADRDELRAELGIDGVCFLYVGRLAREKGVDVLLRAFELVGPHPPIAKLDQLAADDLACLRDVVGAARSRAPDCT